MNRAAPVLQMRQVSVAIGRQDIVADVTVDAAAGELIAIIGANGSGKTTLMRAIAGLVPTRQGQLTCFGRPASSVNRRDFARQLSYMPQQTEMSFGFSVEEVVLLGRYAHMSGAGFANDDDMQFAQQAMEQCGIYQLAARRFDQLSGGEARRVLLAQALCQQAKCLLLDEPTAAIDVAHAHHLMQILQDHCQKDGLALVITHDLDLAIRYATRVWLMNCGKLIADDSPHQVLASVAAGQALGISLHIGQLPSGQSFVVPA
jgi:iron complex transport system ATP-binding protein